MWWLPYNLAGVAIALVATGIMFSKRYNGNGVIPLTLLVIATVLVFVGEC